jgi:hypothetical protein
MSADREKVYGLLIMQPSQEPQIKAHCFGDCGKISMAGALMDEELGGIFVCRQEVCPHVDKQMDEPLGTTTFHHERGDTTYDVYLRTIKPLAAASPTVDAEGRTPTNNEGD